MCAVVRYVSFITALRGDYIARRFMHTWLTTRGYLFVPVYSTPLSPNPAAGSTTPTLLGSGDSSRLVLPLAFPLSMGNYNSLNTCHSLTTVDLLSTIVAAAQSMCELLMRTHCMHACMHVCFGRVCCGHLILRHSH